MKQSFNDCLYSLGSTVTLASSTAFSFSSQPSLHAGLPVQGELPSWAGTRNLHFAAADQVFLGGSATSLKLPCHHTSYQSLCCHPGRNLPCLHNCSTSPLPPNCSANSSSPSAWLQGGELKDHLAPGHSSAGDQGHAAAAHLDTSLVNQQHLSVCNPSMVTLRVTISALCSPRPQLGEFLTVFIFIEG